MKFTFTQHALLKDVENIDWAYVIWLLQLILWRSCILLFCADCKKIHQPVLVVLQQKTT